MKLDDLNLEQKDIADAIIHELNGLTVADAKSILKYVLAELKNRAIVDETLRSD